MVQRTARRLPLQLQAGASVNGLGRDRECVGVDMRDRWGVGTVRATNAGGLRASRVRVCTDFIILYYKYLETFPLSSKIRRSSNAYPWQLQ